MYGYIQFKPCLLDQRELFNKILSREDFCWRDQNSFFDTSFDLSNAENSYYSHDSKIFVLTWSSLYNCLDIVNALGKAVTTQNHAELIYLLYQKFGPSCVDYIQGDFTFVIYNTETQDLFCGRDRMGVRPFYYYYDEQSFAFSSSLSFFHTLATIDVKPSLTWICHFMVDRLSMDFENTAYENIYKLPPSHTLNIQKKHKVLQRYFSFSTEKIKLNDSREYIEFYKETLDNVIGSQISGLDRVGCELSGGLDSTTLMAYLSGRYSGEQLHAFGFAMLEHEPARILRLSQHFGVTNSYLSCHNDYAKGFDREREFRAIGGLAEHTDAADYQHFYKIAQQNKVGVLFSGFGGDECVTSIHSDMVYRELLIKHKWKALYHALPGTHVTKGLRVLKQALSKNYCKSTLYQAYLDRWGYRVITDESVKRYQLEDQYFKTARFDQDYDSLDMFTLERRLVPFVTTRMENCTLMAASYGVEYRWPLLDSRLMQCFLSIPSEFKVKNGMGRYLHRAAISHLAPQETVWQKSKYMGEQAVPDFELDSVSICSPLHPVLTAIIDQTKFEQQVHQLKTFKSKLSPEQAFAYDDNLVNIEALDKWLKYYYPDQDLQ